MLLATLAALAVTVAGRETRLDAAALAALPQSTATASFHGATTSCTGPRLDAVLAAAGAPAGTALAGPALTQAVLATGADGYRAAFTLAALDPLLGDDAVIVATSCAGKPLPTEDGPLRLLADGDKRGARSVRRLVRVEVKAIP